MSSRADAPRGATAAGASWAEFRARVHDALARLHDPPGLETHALAGPAAADRGADRDRRRGTPGQVLRRALLEAVDALKAAGRPTGPGAPRAHRLLSRRYLDGAPIGAVQRELTVSRSEYFREHARAVDAVAAVLWERWGLAAPGAPAGAPALLPRAPATRAALDLPAQLSSFVGRGAELAELDGVLGRARLVTVTGPPGTGKSRLALRLAAAVGGRYRDGVRFVPLDALTDPGLVLAAVARAVGVAETGRRPMIELLVDGLRDRRLLLLVDNCEHLLAAAPEIGALVGGCPALSVLATSRAPLRVAGEHELALAPLPVPEPTAAGQDDRLLANPAVRLFVDRARAVQADFAADRCLPTVAAICRRLDGLPLAIELAAARVRLLPVEALLERLEALGGAIPTGPPDGRPASGGRLELLGGGARDLPPRQRTLRAALAWSHDLLDAPARALLRRLAVFAGGWTLEHAGAVCGVGAGAALLEGLAALVEHSLVVREPTESEPRYRMLETIREYALERLLESGEAPTIRGAHARAMLALAEPSEAGLRGPDQLAWLARLDREHDNLRAALRWACDRRDADLAPRLAAALFWYWNLRGHMSEGRAWLEAALALSPPPEVSPVRGWVARGAAALTWMQGDFAAAARLGEEALRVARAVGDDRLLATALFRLGLVASGEGAAVRSEEFIEQARAAARAAGDHHTQALALSSLGVLAAGAGEPDRAAALEEEALRHARRVEDRYLIALALTRLGEVAIARGEHGRARQVIGEALGLWQVLDQPLGLADCLEDLALLAAATGAPARSVRLAGAASRLRDGDWRHHDPRRSGFHGQLTSLLGDISPERREELWQEGRAMTRDEALAYALGRSMGSPT